MALLTYDWKAPDPTGAVNAWLAGARLGQAENEQRQQALEAAARQRIEEERTKQLLLQHQQNMALQLAQEARLERADQIRQKYAADKYAEAHEPFTPLPIPDVGSTGSGGANPLPTSDVSGGVADDSATTPGLQLNFDANQSLGQQPISIGPGSGDVALELAQASPFRRQSALAEDDLSQQVRFGGDVDQGDNSFIDENPGVLPISDTPLLESSNFIGGVSPPQPPEESPDGLPAGEGNGVDAAGQLMAGGATINPVGKNGGAPPAALSPDAVRRINFAGQNFGKKEAEAVTRRELAAAAKTPPAAADPSTYVVGDDGFFHDPQNPGAAFKKVDLGGGKVHFTQVAAPSTADTSKYVAGEDGFFHDPDNPAAAFKKTDLGGGKARYTQVITPIASQSESFKRIAGFEKDGVFRINPDDPREVYVEKFTTKGTPYYSPVEPKVQKFGDKPYMVGIDGSLHPIEIDNQKPLPQWVQKTEQEIQRKLRLNQQSLAESRKNGDKEGIQTAQTSIDNLTQQLDLLQTRNPQLKAAPASAAAPATAAPAAPAAPAATPAPANLPKPQTKDDFDKLASGTIYLGKDGKQYRKP